MLLVGCNKESGKINSSSPQTKEESEKINSSSPKPPKPDWEKELDAEIDAARHAKYDPAEAQGLKVLSVTWKGPYSGSWVPTFVVRNDGPKVDQVTIEYQAFDGEVLVGSHLLFFNSGIPSNTTAKQQGIPIDSEAQPKLKVVKISLQ